MKTISGKLSQEKVSGKSESCIFCTPKSMNPFMIRSALYIKYSSTQNFYYTKDINDLLFKSKSPSSILLKDQTTYYLEHEHLRRVYQGKEIPNKLKVLGEYYRFHTEFPRIYAASVVQYLGAYNEEQRRLEYDKIMKIMQTQNEKTSTSTKQVTEMEAPRAENRIEMKNKLLNTSLIEDLDNSKCSIQKKIEDLSMLTPNTSQFLGKNSDLQEENDRKKENFALFHPHNPLEESSNKGADSFDGLRSFLKFVSCNIVVDKIKPNLKCLNNSNEFSFILSKKTQEQNPNNKNSNKTQKASDELASLTGQSTVGSDIRLKSLSDLTNSPLPKHKLSEFNRGKLRTKTMKLNNIDNKSDSNEFLTPQHVKPHIQLKLKPMNSDFLNDKQLNLLKVSNNNSPLSTKSPLIRTPQNDKKESNLQTSTGKLPDTDEEKKKSIFQRKYSTYELKKYQPKAIPSKKPTEEGRVKPLRTDNLFSIEQKSKLMQNVLTSNTPNDIKDSRSGGAKVASSNSIFPDINRKGGAAPNEILIKSNSIHKCNKSDVPRGIAESVSPKRKITHPDNKPNPTLSIFKCIDSKGIQNGPKPGRKMSLNKEIPLGSTKSIESPLVTKITDQKGAPATVFSNKQELIPESKPSAKVDASQNGINFARRPKGSTKSLTMLPYVFDKEKLKMKREGLRNSGAKQL